ncbi:MAG: alcohol dehydrogenase catalytic domain-containing protein [Planctomycetaceae bacterium]|nr:alcohol dehydrogenase catalytic domain-containing protein [Planctomycetaceae bacterium]
MKQTMKAAVYLGNDQMTVKEVPLPEIDDNSALLKVKACAVCGSDIRIYHSGNSRVTPPAILGHEISGEIVAVGKNVTKVKVGDRVAIGADVPCGQCYFCKAGIGNNCQINYAMGYQFQGGYAEYLPLNSTVVNFGPITKIPDGMSFDEGALAEPLACVLNALELTPIKLNDTFVLMGAGPIGLMLCEVAKILGAGKIILINRSAPRLETAKKLNLADVYICAQNENAVERVLEETGGLGANVIFTANPSPDAHTDAIKMAVNRGRINLFGGLPRDNKGVTIDTNTIHYKELMVTGAHGSMPQHHELAVHMIASGRINIKKFMTHQFNLDDILTAFKAAEDHAGLRVIVHP